MVTFGAMSAEPVEVTVSFTVVLTSLLPFALN
jgi:hypothetical protein